MKKSVLTVLTLLTLSIFAIGSVAAADGDCTLDVLLLNQDPIKAVPGEYVDVVFQVQGVENSACETVTFQLLPEYPFSVDPNVNTEKIIESGTFTTNYNTQATIPFSLRVDPSALDKNHLIKVRYSTSRQGNTLAITDQFNISVEDVKADFDIFVDDYIASSNTITFNILNIGKNDVEALTVEVPKQEGLNVKGSNKAIIGTLDANQDTTFTYEATPSDGNLEMIVHYNDENGERRSVTKEVAYDSSYFTGRARDTQQGSSMGMWITIILIALVVIYFVRRRMRKNKEMQHHRR